MSFPCVLFLIVAICSMHCTSAFTIPSCGIPVVKPPFCRSSSSTLAMVRFDPTLEKWVPTAPEDEVGYGPMGTLLRAGPKPFLIRVFNPDNYEQGVFKFMYKENMSRLEAQGNFDAYLENPNDWAYQYFQEKNGGYKKDYVNEGMDPQSLALKGIWSSLVFALAIRGIYCYNTGEYFYEFLRFASDK